MSQYIEDANKRANMAAESLKMAAESLKMAEESLKIAEEKCTEYVSNPANQPLDDNNPTFKYLSSEVAARRAQVSAFGERQKNSENLLAHLSSLLLTEITEQRDLLLQRSPTIVTEYPLSLPSNHPSEHSLTEEERQTRNAEKIIRRMQRTEQNDDFKNETIFYYYGQPETNLRDMLTGFEFQRRDIHRSHIFQASWSDIKFKELLSADGLIDQNITKDSPQNMLLLHAHVERKYDNGQLLFEYDGLTQTFVCRILDKSISDDAIFLEPIRVTFGQYDGAALSFPTDSRPLRRLIRFRAIVNRNTAVCRNYIRQDEFLHLMNSDDWSPRGTEASIINWSSHIPADSHLYVDTAPAPVPEDD